MSIIKIKRGINSSLPAGGTVTGEPRFSTDTGQLYIDDGTDNIEITPNATNVQSAGALMDSEVDADLKTLVLPASTTITAFAQTFLDDTTQGAVQTTLGVDPAGTDNSTDVTLVGTGTYLSIVGQAITVDPITESDITDLGAYITDITGSPLSELSDTTITTIGANEILKWSGTAWINNTLAEAGISATGHSHTESDITDLQSYLLPTDIGVTVLAEQTIGIADNNLVETDSTTIASGEYAKFTANGLESKSISEMKTDLAYTDVITYHIDGAGNVLSTGLQDAPVGVGFNCTINKVVVLADATGSVVVDIWKDTYTNFPPTVADTITASAKPTLSSARKSSDATLTGWSSDLLAEDILFYNVDSATTVTFVTVLLYVTRT